MPNATCAQQPSVPPANTVPVYPEFLSPVLSINGVRPDANGNVAGVATTTALSTLASSMPQPSAAVPPAPAPTGAPGTGNTFTPANAIPPSLTRSTTATTASDGTFSVTWAVPLVSAKPVVNLMPLNTGSQPAICNPTAVSSTGLTGKCWSTQTTALTLALVTSGVTVNPTANTAAGMQVFVFSREPTQ